MSEAENTQVVKSAYAAFQRGDIPAVLATLDDPRYPRTPTAPTHPTRPVGASVP